MTAVERHVYEAAVAGWLQAARPPRRPALAAGDVTAVAAAAVNPEPACSARGGARRVHLGARGSRRAGMVRRPSVPPMGTAQGTEIMRAGA